MVAGTSSHLRPDRRISASTVPNNTPPMVATRVSYLLRESDTIARIGGDEFVVLLPAIVSREDAVEVANRIIVALTSPYTLDGIEEKISIGVSIGIALYPKDGADRDALIKSADAAMYKSKCVGNCYFFHEAATGHLPES